MHEGLGEDIDTVYFHSTSASDRLLDYFRRINYALEDNSVISAGGACQFIKEGRPVIPVFSLALSLSLVTPDAKFHLVDSQDHG